MGTFLRSSLAIVEKDLRIQFRQKSLLLSMIVFALLIQVLLHFSFQANQAALNHLAAGLLWLPIFLSTLLGIGRLMAIEEAEWNWEGMWMAPVDPGAIFFGKMLGNLFLVFLVECVSVPLFFILFNPPVPQSLPLLIGCLLMGTWGYVTLASLFSVMAQASRLGDLLLPILLFPISVPLQRSIGGMLGFSAGFLLAIAILDLIPESLETNESNVFLILLGLLSVYFLGLLTSGHNHGEMTIHHAHSTPRRAEIGLLLGMLIHTFFDGASIIAAFDVSHQIGVLVFFAVILHKIPDGLTVATLIVANTKNRSRAFLASLALGVSTLLGALVMNALLTLNVQWNQEQIAAMALAFSAGAFLFVAVGDVLPEIHHENKIVSTVTVALGILGYLLTTYLLSLSGLIHHH